MVADSIEREVEIEAPIETVWAIVTEPEHIGTWLGDSAEVELRPGGELAIKFGDFGTAVGTVEEVQRPTLFAFRWVTPEPDLDPNRREGWFTRVEFHLRAAGDATMVRMVESGFASIAGTDGEGAALAERHTGGWGTFMGRLADYAMSVDVSA
ncbi:MAG: SRPBCC domain-containing protein [Solirubrobacterales bacterium]